MNRCSGEKAELSELWVVIGTTRNLKSLRGQETCDMLRQLGRAEIGGHFVSG